MFERFYINRLYAINGKNENRIFNLFNDIRDATNSNIERMLSKKENGDAVHELIFGSFNEDADYCYFCAYFDSDYIKKCLPVFAVLNKTNSSLLIVPINRCCKPNLSKAVFLKNDEYDIYCKRGEIPPLNELISSNELRIFFYSEKIESKCHIDMREARLCVPEKIFPGCAMSSVSSKHFPYLIQPEAIYKTKDFFYELLKNNYKNASKEA